MPSYGSFGGMDDQIFSDGDVGFVGMNQRLSPNQLGSGEVVLSRNGRIDGYWQPRKGIQLRSGALSNSATPLAIPFYLIDTPKSIIDVTIPDIAQVSGTLTSDGVTPVVFPDMKSRGFQNGKMSYVSLDNLSSISWDGSSWQMRWFYDPSISVGWESVDNVATPDLVTTWTPLFLSTGVPVVTISPEADVVRLEITSHGLLGSGWAELKGLDSNVNGVRFLDVINFDLIDAIVPGVTSITDTSGTLDAAPINNGAVSAVYGSCLFSDPSSGLEESVLLATNLDAKRVNLNTLALTSLPYPTGVVVSSDVEMIQAFDRVYLFRDGARALEWVPGGKIITSASLTSNVVTVTVRNHGLETGDEVTLSGLTFTGTDPNGLRTVTVTGVDTFTFALTSADETYGVTNAKMVAVGFTFVLGGPYTQPQTFIVASNAAGFSVVDGLVSLPVTSNTTIKAGDFVTIYETTIPVFSAVVGKSFQVTSATSTLIQFFAPVGNFTAGGSNQIEVGGRFSVGGGFIHQPGFPWATYFQRRLWGPYWYEPNGTTASPTYTDRKIRDEIVASDILDGDTYDQIFSQFRITAGIADYLVGMQPFYEDALMVLNRNSLHVVTGTQGSLEDTVVKELTREVGCLARKSVVGKGNAVFFLSDSGVYGVEFIEQYNLRGLEEPLSKNIQPFIDRINKDKAAQSVGIFFNNRYWLAVPLDTSAGQGDATGNNSILIYNTLNKAWESIDTYNIPNFNIKNFIIGQSGERNSLYLVNDTGGLHEVDAQDSPIDVYSTNTIGGSQTAAMTYELVSRGYMLGATNFERKKFSRAQIQLESGDQSSDLDFYFSSEDPDTDKFRVSSVNDLIGQNLPANETGNFRIRLGNPRGLYGSLTISSVSIGSSPVGRPKVNSITIDGTITNRQTLSQF